MANTLRKIIIYPLILGSLALAGCRDMSKDYQVESTYKGFPATATSDTSNKIVICLDKKDISRKCIMGDDIDKDGDMDTIKRYSVNPESPLGKLATFDELKKAFDEVSKDGRK